MLSTRFSQYKRLAVMAPALLALLALSVAGCGGSHDDGDPNLSRTRLTGEYTYGFETSAFRPCGSTKSYWVTTGKQAIQDAVPGDYSSQKMTTVYVDVVGQVSPSGSYGNLGLYEHEFAVEQVYSGSPTIPDTCQ